MKVLFVIPPYFNIDDFINKHRANVLPAFTIPYGILSLEAYLKAQCENTVEISILDLNVPLKEILAELGKDEDRKKQVNGQRHTDACINWEDTVAVKKKLDDPVNQPRSTKKQKIKSPIFLPGSFN